MKRPIQALLGLAAWGVIVAVACGGGESSTVASTYYPKLEGALGNAARTYAATSAPALTEETLSAEDKAAIQVRYKALSSALGDAADAIAGLAPPSKMKSDHGDAVQGLRMQADGLGTLSGMEPTPMTVESDLAKLVLPGQRLFASACANLQKDAASRKIDVKLACEL